MFDICRDQLHLSPCAFNKHLVFRKVRCEHDHFLSGIQESVQAAAQSAGSTGRNIQAVRADGIPEVLPDRLCDPLSGIFVSLRAGISMHRYRIHFLKQTDRCLIDRVRSRDRRIADREVEHILGTDLCDPLHSELEQVPDDRTLHPKSHRALVYI